jgi:pimeloyl-ACP methyl ester carboxylesterase
MSTRLQVERRFVALDSPTGHVNGAGFHPCQGVWHAPANTKPRVGVLATHYSVDFSEHYLGPHLARHGMGLLGWNTRYRNNESWFALEHALVDIGVGVRWLRQEAGVEAVVLLGNCGGGSLMAAYQSQATSPVLEPTTGGRRLAGALGALEPGDLYVSLQAHPGRPEVLTNWLDPSVTDERDPLSRRDDLDMYDARHGPPYDEAFVARYRAAQLARNDRITDWALAELGRLEAAGVYDRNFNVHRTWADLRFTDPTLDPSDRPTPRCLAGDPRAANANPYGIAATCSVRSWLSLWSMRHSQCRGEAHLRRITCPALVLQSTGDVSVFPSDARMIAEALASPDTSLEWVEGDHYLEAPEGARAGVAERIVAWAAARTR